MPADAPNRDNMLVGDAYRQEYLAHNPVALCETDMDAAHFERELARYRHLLPARDPLRVLDLGCGSGAGSLEWRRRGARVTGVDFDPDLIELARKRPGLEEGFVGIVANAAEIPLPDASFDLVLSHSLLEHIADWRPALLESVRVLAPGGVLVLITTNRYHPFQGEINRFPFYPWLPAPVQRRILGWIMQHRRDLVNYTNFPAVNWFTIPWLRRELAALGLRAYDRLDLMRADSGGSGMKGRVARLLAPTASRGARGKALFYVATATVALYAKRPESGA